MTIFDDLETAMANAFNIDVTSAGYILGIVVIVAVFVAVLLVIREDANDTTVALLGGSMMAFVVLVGWWPIWTGIFAALLVMYAIVKPFGGRAEGGGI